MSDGDTDELLLAPAEQDSILAEPHLPSTGLTSRAPAVKPGE
jgi:hypothetical protein